MRELLVVALLFTVPVGCEKAPNPKGLVMAKPELPSLQISIEDKQPTDRRIVQKAIRAFGAACAPLMKYRQDVK
jgi:hypothetical protein